MIPIHHALRLTRVPPAEIRVAFVGSGGKTTAMFQLAREFSPLLPSSDRPPVLLTTTTHLGAWQIPLADTHLEITGENVGLDPSRVQGVTLITGPAVEDQPVPFVSSPIFASKMGEARRGSRRRTVSIEDQPVPTPVPTVVRVQGPGALTLENLDALAGRLSCPLLVEADGSRRLPLKAPAPHEPVIPAWARQVVAAAGLSALGKALDGGVVHRFERYAALAEQAVGSPITIETIARVLLHPDGGLKGIPPMARKAALLTQVGQQGWEDAVALARLLLAGFESVLIAGEPQAGMQAAFEPCAGVVLAAGSASRFGGPKILVDWHGKPLIRHVVEIALQSGLAQVIVVTGALHDATRRVLEGLPVTLAPNPPVPTVDWAAGQSSSLKAGIQAISDQVGAALFLLADQPFISAELLRALHLAHARTLAPVIAPVVGGRRANPVLFDRSLFPDLLRVSGDQGGRAIFQQHPPLALPWQDDRLLLDVDTPEDYERLLRF